MEYQLKEEIISRLKQIIQSIDVLNLMRIQFIGETALAIDKKTDKSLDITRFEYDRSIFRYLFPIRERQLNFIWSS